VPHQTHVLLQYPRPVFVGADLSKCTLQDALQGTGFDAAKPSLFICEGLVYYLPEVHALLPIYVLHLTCVVMQNYGCMQTVFNHILFNIT